MAFSGMILKASSRPCVVSLARCAVRTSRTLNTSVFGYESQLRSFSSTSADNKDLVDAELYKALKHEYNLSKIMGKHSQHVNIPTPSSPFKRIRDILYGDFVLKREFPDGEEVFVIAYIGNRKELECSKKDQNEAISIEDNKTPAIPVTVRVENNKGYFGVNISVCTENIIIKSIDDGWDSWAKYEELDDELRQALTEYLNVRGVNRETLLSFLEVEDVCNQKADFLALKHFMKVVK